MIIAQKRRQKKAAVTESEKYLRKNLAVDGFKSDKAFVHNDVGIYGIAFGKRNRPGIRVNHAVFAIKLTLMGMSVKNRVKPSLRRIFFVENVAVTQENRLSFKKSAAESKK